MLQDRAMLVDVSLSAYSPRKQSKRIANAAAQVLGIDPEFAIGSKRLASKDHFQAINNLDGQIRQFMYLWTRPWMDKGMRILPSNVYFDFTDGLAKLLDKRENLVEELAEKWPEIVEQSKAALNGEFDPADFPADIRKSYSHNVVFLPIPREGDFRAPAELSQTEVAKIESAMMDRIQAAFSSTDLWQRIQDALITDKGPLGDRLRSYGTDVNGKVMGTFRDSLIENVRELVTILPRLNVAQDPKVNEICARLIQDVCVHEPQTLREDPVLREDVASQVDKILAEVSAFMG